MINISAQKKYYEKNKKTIVDNSRKYRLKSLKDKKFFCEPCKKAFYDKTSLKSHLKIKKHNPSRYVKYICPFNDCNHITKSKTAHNNHLKIKKHIKSK